MAKKVRSTDRGEFLLVVAFICCCIILSLNLMMLLPKDKHGWMYAGTFNIPSMVAQFFMQSGFMIGQVKCLFPLPYVKKSYIFKTIQNFALPLPTQGKVCGNVFEKHKLVAVTSIYVKPSK